MQKKIMSELEILEAEGEEGKPLIIMLHGYGAHYEDLAPLQKVMSFAGKCSWVFPNAPLEIPIMMFTMGRAWFPIDVEELQQAMSSGREREFRIQRGKDYEYAAEKIADLVKLYRPKFQKILLGGFSQGGMVAMEALFGKGAPADGLILLSSATTEQETWTSSLEGLKDFPIFQSHGEQDPVLPYSKGKELEALFDRPELDYEFHSFSGGHEIPPPILQQLDRFVQCFSED